MHHCDSWRIKDQLDVTCCFISLHVPVTQLGLLLTRSGLTYSQVSSKVYHDSFCQSDSSVALPWVIYFKAFYLHVVSSFCCIPIICPKLVLFLTPLQFVYLFCNLYQVCPAVLLMYFISAAVILLASLALIVQISLSYNKTGRASLLYSFILVYIYIYCVYINIYYIFLCSNAPHVLVDFVVFPPGHGRSVTDFWVWDAHEARLRCPDDVSGDIGGCNARRALKPNFY